MKNTYVNCVTVYVNWRRNSDCAIVHSMSSVIDNQYGLESDVIILTSLKRTLQFALSLSVSVLKRFDCIVLKKTIEKMHLADPRKKMINANNNGCFETPVTVK